MTDVAPELFESIVNTFNQLCSGDRILADLRQQIQNGTATYRQAYQYAERCGMHLSGVLHAVLKEDNLPNGTLYYNIAEKTLGQALHMNAEQILNMVRQIQETINEKAGVKLKPVEVPVNEDRIHEIVSAAANAETYEKAAVQFDEPVTTESRRAVDDSLKANARFHDKAGLEVRVEREYDGVGLHDGTDACEWCLERAGSFTYDKAMAVGAFERHEGCGCIIDYTSKKGVTTRSTGRNSGWEEQKAKENRIKAAFEGGIENQKGADRISLANLFNNVHSRTRRELQERTEMLKTITDSYTTVKSKWSGKLIVNNMLKIETRASGRKAWNCNIEIINTATDGDIIHELLHSYSISQYARKDVRKVYTQHKLIEEASTEYLAQQICKAEGLTDGGAYDRLVKKLEILYPYSGAHSELEFAKTLFSQPLTDRMNWLATNVANNALRKPSLTQNDAIRIMDALRGLKND